MSRKRAETTITTKAPEDEGAEPPLVQPQNGQQQAAAAATELSPIGRYRAAQEALENTRKRLADLAETLKEHQQHRVGCEQQLIELRAGQRQAQARIPVAEEAVNAAKADALLVKMGTTEARAAAGKVAAAEQRVEEAKAAAEQAKTAVEAALSEAAESTRKEMEIGAEIAELRPLLPHLEERIREAHKAIGLAIARDHDGRIARAEQVLAYTRKQAADAEAALKRAQVQADAALVDYPEVRATRPSAVPVPPSPFEELLQQQLRHLELLAASVNRVNYEALPLTPSNSPFWHPLVIDPRLVASAFQSRDPNTFKPAMQAITEYLGLLRSRRAR